MNEVPRIVAGMLFIGKIGGLLGGKTQSPAWQDATIQEQFSILVHDLQRSKNQSRKDEPTCQGSDCKVEVGGSRIWSGFSLHCVRISRIE
jgi:hypothetical protein